MLGQSFLFARNFELEFLDDLARDLALGCQQVGHLAIVLLTPEQLVVTDVDEFGANRKIIPTLDNPSRKHRTHAKFLADFDGIYFPALVMKDCASGTDFQVG